MTKKFTALLLVIYLSFGTIGCSVTTTGKSSWEAFVGVRAEQHSEEPATVKVESTFLDKLMDMFSWGNDSEKE